MKRYIKYLISAFSLLIIGYIVLSSFTTPEEDIIGTWVSEEDSNWKIKFNDDGTCLWYYTNEITDTYTYTITTTTPQCGYEVKTGSEYYYLKLIDADGGENCYEILGVDSLSLSISTISLGVKNHYFNKQ